MADYDSATPLYEFLPNHWHNADRGKIPLAWGINPNLLETYPDLIAYFYEHRLASRHLHRRCQCGRLHEPEPNP